MTKTKIALAAVLFAATSSSAFADGFYDPDLANRYPSYANPNTYGYSASGDLGGLHSSQVRLQQHGNVYLQAAPVWQQSDVALRAGNVDANDWFAVEQSDRASSPYAGGN